MTQLRSLKGRLRRLEQRRFGGDESLLHFVIASYVPRPAMTPEQRLQFDEVCLASLAQPDIPRGRYGWLEQQIILRSAGRWAARGLSTEPNGTMQ